MIQYDDAVTDAQRKTLEPMANGLVAAANCTSLIWTVHESQPGRRWLRLCHYTNRNQVFAEVAEPDVNRIDEAILKKQIIERTT